MQELFPILLREEPPIKLYSLEVDFRSPGNLVGIAHGEGVMLVRPWASKLPPRMTLYSILASLGLSNQEIADNTGSKYPTVKSTLGRGSSRLNLLSRSEISSRFVQSGVYEILRYSPPFLNPAEIPVIEKVSEGWSNKEVGRELHLSGLTVKSHLANITERTNWSGREAIVFAAILSGELVIQNQISLQLLKAETAAMEPPADIAVPPQPY